MNLKLEIIDHITSQAKTPITPELTKTLNRLTIPTLRILRTAFLATYDAGKEDGCTLNQKETE